MKYNGFRAIIIIQDRLVVMERKKENRHYFVLPGGHLENNESFEECVIREVNEEFGIEVRPIKIIYDLVAGNDMQGIFLCEYVSGVLGKTEFGEEYQQDRNRGEYNPTSIPKTELKNINLVPTELKEQLISDLENLGNNLDREKLSIILNLG